MQGETCNRRTEGQDRNADQVFSVRYRDYGAFPSDARASGSLPFVFSKSPANDDRAGHSAKAGPHSGLRAHPERVDPKPV